MNSFLKERKNKKSCVLRYLNKYENARFLIISHFNPFAVEFSRALMQLLNSIKYCLVTINTHQSNNAFRFLKSSYLTWHYLHHISADKKYPNFE